MAVGIINSRQVSPVDFFLGLVDKFDHPTGRTIAQGLDFDNFLVYQNHLTNRIQRVELSLWYMQGRAGILIAIFT